MTPEHLKEIRDAKLVRPDNMAEALFHLGFAQGHRQVLLEYVAELEARIAYHVEQAEQGIFAEHECPAFYACACIVADAEDNK